MAALNANAYEAIEMNLDTFPILMIHHLLKSQQMTQLDPSPKRYSEYRAMCAMVEEVCTGSTERGRIRHLLEIDHFGMIPAHDAYISARSTAMWNGGSNICAACMKINSEPICDERKKLPPI